MELQIGDVVTLTTNLLGNEKNTKGVVYDLYPDFDYIGKLGASIIFENGEYDGFSLEEQERFLKKENIKYIPFYIREYNFKNVMNLSQDFENGFWDEIFK